MGSVFLPPDGIAGFGMLGRRRQGRPTMAPRRWIDRRGVCRRMMPSSQSLTARPERPGTTSGMRAEPPPAGRKSTMPVTCQVLASGVALRNVANRRGTAGA